MYNLALHAYCHLQCLTSPQPQNLLALDSPQGAVPPDLPSQGSSSRRAPSNLYGTNEPSTISSAYPMGQAKFKHTPAHPTVQVILTQGAASAGSSLMRTEAVHVAHHLALALSCDSFKYLLVCCVPGVVPVVLQTVVVEWKGTAVRRRSFEADIQRGRPPKGHGENVRNFVCLKREAKS
jgi:hypothetical protein